MTHPEKTTHFGFESVAWDDKANKVGDVFDAVATRYDIMNDLMSLGVHRLWKRFTLAKSLVRPGQHILDLAGGSGDITQLLTEKTGPTGRVVLADINAAMLTVGRDRLIDKGLLSTVDVIQANAEALPFSSNQFDCITIGFGLRNVTDKARALASMYRVCKPGGKLLVLEFSTPTAPGLKPIYDAYSFHILPKLGQWITKDAESYQYLVESIRMHPNQADLKTMIETAGFEDCTYHNLSGGIVALHIAYKY
ncbi:MAG: bifunctional demethylmenaquinone methyltransferase/2-methoxy-6-polyprenyl-1,4-benzoquinol methylase UbiE [Legionella sp.]|nr:bifunctional demethylmenaquinone methyltransferase/2-methoxy-6-polyprenyl-1,4-benzoquinol methylase UbiE [Legionella sp.]